ncbi:MAG: Asp-tRNA(Asn)/Glu-tRNA(Gln) amidotransferase subunit GatC [Candidatus Omnitrophota bacterium]
MSVLNLRHIAHLSRLHFTDEELKLFESQVADILKFVEELNKVDVQGIEPTSHPLSLENVFRGDHAKPALPVEAFLKHAPKVRGRFFEVPKIIEDKS